VTFKEKEMQEEMQNFIVKLNEMNGEKMLAKAKILKGAEIFENGIIMETLRPVLEKEHNHRQLMMLKFIIS